jgi:electron transport complex protein RnfG
MYRAMVGVGVACGLLIVGVFQATRPVIERNKAEALKSAIFHVLPDASSSKTYAYQQTDGFSVMAGDDSGAARVHAGYDGEGELVGVAVEAEGMGYQDVIRLIYGYSFAEDAIIGIQVLESKETPGLGDKIETDPDFLENFERLDVSLSEDGSALAHSITAVRHGEKEHPWEVDGITGATISSEAIASILNRSAQSWAPRIQGSLRDLQGSE